MKKTVIMLPKLKHIPQASDIIETHRAIEKMIHRTPVLSSKNLNAICGCRLFFKCENFQKVGAFKMRGASSAALRLQKEELKKGITTHSSGNHAQATALAAKFLGVPAFIVMPSDAPASKRNATSAYGAEIIECEPNLQSRESTLDEVVKRTEATFIHPYNDYNIIAGQATAAMELLEDTEDLDIIVAPIGGGGLMSGTALSTRFFSPGTKVFGAEPKEVNDAYRSFKSGKIQYNTSINTIADGLKTNLGEKTFDIIKKEVDEIFTVSEASIVQAMRLIWERMKIVIEPSGAVPLAAILSYPEIFKGKQVGLIISGGNVDLEKLPF